MECTIIYTIYYIVVSLINSIGKKWDDELRGIWEYAFKSYMTYVWIPLIIDAIMNITIFLIRK